MQDKRIWMQIEVIYFDRVIIQECGSVFHAIFAHSPHLKAWSIPKRTLPSPCRRAFAFFLKQIVYAHDVQVGPNESQSRRDDVETPRMWKFLRKHLDVFSFAEGDLDRKLRETDEVPED